MGQNKCFVLRFKNAYDLLIKLTQYERQSYENSAQKYEGKKEEMNIQIEPVHLIVKQLKHAIIFWSIQYFQQINNYNRRSSIQLISCAWHNFYYIMKISNQSPEKTPFQGHVNNGQQKPYWKRNYYLEFTYFSQNYWMKTPISDPIQRYSLVEHQTVIIQTLANRQFQLQGPDFRYQQLRQPPYESLNFEQIDYFLQDMIEQENQFTPNEAKDFRYYLNVRKDWKNIFVELSQKTNWRYHFQLAFLFFTSIKIIVEIISPWNRRTSDYLSNFLKEYFSKQLNNLKQRLPYFRVAPDFQDLAFKIVLTMMLSAYGIFVNPYCNRKSKVFILLYSSIKQQEEENNKKKKIKCGNVKRRRRVEEEENNMPSKRIKNIDQ